MLIQNKNYSSFKKRIYSRTFLKSGKRAYKSKGMVQSIVDVNKATPFTESYITSIQRL